jgi:hypothetical protein
MDRYCASNYTFSQDPIDDQILNCMSLLDNHLCRKNCCQELQKPYSYYRLKYGSENADWMTSAVERLGCKVSSETLHCAGKCEFKWKGLRQISARKHVHVTHAKKQNNHDR